MSPGETKVDDYAAWRDRFARERLRTLYYLGLVANPVFFLSDFLFYRPHLSVLLSLRVVLEAGFLLAFVQYVYRPSRVNPKIPLILWIVIGNLCIAQMTVFLGGFTSPYYNGLNLVFLAAAVIVPISWRAHLTAQLISLAYYYGLNLLSPLGPGAQEAAIQNSFFLLWTCVACLFSVNLYEELQTAEFQSRERERCAREELEVSHRKLLELDRLKDQFFANISHELRTPLTLSLGAFKTLLKQPLSPGSYGVVQSGLRNTARLLFLINELLELARFESGRVDMRKVCVDLVALVKNVAANFQSSGRQRIFLEGTDEPLPLEVDVRKMMKVIYNLLANAFKFSDSDQATVWIRLRSESNHVAIEIEDTGIGIPEDQWGRIFERFTQVEGDTMRRFEGSGIGLALAKEIVTLHDGHITVQSVPGKGSTFTVTLPRGTSRDIVPLEDDETFVLPSVRSEEGSAGSEQGAVESQNMKSDRPLVLIVDDNADMRAYLARLLTDEYGVMTASNGIEGLAYARQHGPALVVTDIMMPVMSGYDLLCAMRNNEALSKIPVILLTARAGTEAPVESLEAGADDYVSKPFHEEELLARIKNQLRIHRQERELESRAKELEDLYAKLELANAELRDLNLRKSEFVSIVSHDLRTPLTAIDGFVDNLLSELGGPLSPKQRQYLERIQVNIGRLVRMINDLLDLTKIEAGTIEFRPKPIRISTVLDSLMETLGPVARQKDIHLRSEASPTEWLVHADPDKLTQILTNLIHNACKFTPAGGEVRIQLSRDADGCVQICVVDTGCGIAAEEIGQVFEKFYSGRSLGSERRGTGLGLAIAKHFVDLHHGRIWVESTPQHGSRFYFTIPVHPETSTRPSVSEGISSDSQSASLS
ncbi:ATP-binding response regulator [Nitrospira sp. Nam74]